jgi:predicted nucleic acid-binding protein
MIFVDTNVLIDVIDNDPVWADWSQRQLDTAAALDELAINDVIYAELAVGYEDQEQLDAMIARSGLILVPAPRIALFLAGKAYQRYRLSGGSRTGVLADFFIGAQAFAAGAQLLTRDPRRYRTYFQGVRLIAPSVN